MALTLRIENYDTLADGSPTWITLDGRSASVGRKRSMDWCLPDPSLRISGHHFDITHRDGSYWISDVSTNGTYLQGQSHRLQGAYLLQGGERLVVGHYIIAADLIRGQAQAPLAGPPAAVLPDVSAEDSDPWDFGAPPQPPAPARPQLPRTPSPFLDMEQDFVPLQRPDQPPFHNAEPIARPAPSAVDLPRPDAYAPPPRPMPAPPPFGVTPEPQRSPPPVAQPSPDPAFIAAFCEGAGLDPAGLSGLNPEDLARELGRTMRVSASEVMRMLQDRANVKHFTRGGDRTMRSATGNNPLKFLPDAEQAVDAMFLRPRDGFMSGAEGFEAALADLRQHQMSVFLALQPALAAVLEGLSPEDIEAVAQSGAKRLVGSRRSKAWELFVDRWDARAGQGEHGMLDAFLQAFARAYMQANDTTN